MGTEVEVIDRKSGWRGSGRLILHVGDSNRTIYFKAFEINDSTFSIKLNGCLVENGDLLINVVLHDDVLSLSFKSDMTGIEGTSSFKFGKDSLREIHQIQKNGEQIFYDVNSYDNSFKEDSKLEDAVSPAAVDLLPEERRPSAVYKLPMGLTYLLYDQTEVADQVEVQTFCGVFLWPDAACADIREYVQSAFLAGTGSRYKKELEGKYVINDRKCVV